MSLDTIINILACLTLIEMMITMGLAVRPGDVLSAGGNLRALAYAVAANYVFVPAVAVSLLLLFRAQSMVAVGFLLVAVCPGAPYGPPFTALAKGNVVLAIGLMVILSSSSAILAPVLLRMLMPLVAPQQSSDINAVQLVGTLALSQLLPFCVGLTVRQWRPRLAQRLYRPLAKISKLLNVSLITLILAVQFRTLWVIPLRGYLGMAALLGATAVGGWLCGGPNAERRRTFALTTAVRNVGVALVIVTGSFPGTPAVTATTAYAILQTVIMALAALGWGRLAPPTTVTEKVRLS